MSGNWLEPPLDPADEADLWLNPLEVSEEPPISSEELQLVPKGISPVSIPAVATERNAVLQAAWDRLSRKQQVFLHQLRASHFNVSDACRVLKKTGIGDAVHRVTARRWSESDEDFAFVLKVMKGIARDRVIDPDRLLLRADEIAEKALEPTPILHQGRATGFYEHQLDTALRANEQIMKTQKMLSNDDAPRTIIEGPGLVIQIVQRDKTVIDVTPRNVTVALAEPEEDFLDGSAT